MSSNNILTIATRESPLALWQARHIQSELQRLNPGLQVELLGMTTRGDQILDSPLAKVGGKGLFVKELENALLDGRADLAVHSTKDMPVQQPDGLQLQIVGQRETPNDALVLAAGNSQSSASLENLPEGAVIGTSSLRRKCQLLQIRPDLQCVDLRGNVNTRLAKLDRGDYQAIVLAAAGLQRLGMGERISALLPTGQLLPAVGQGALAVEFRQGDARVEELIHPLVDAATAICIQAERAMNARLDGGCQVPIAGFAELSENKLSMEGRVAALDGSEMIVANQQLTFGAAEGMPERLQRAAALGEQIADALLVQGADALLAQIEH